MSLKNRRIMLAVVLIVVIAVAAIGVYWYESNSQHAATKDKIVIGFSIPLTGGVAAAAAECQLSNYNLWKDQVNAEGGLYIAQYGKKLPVEYKYYDDKSDPGTTVEVYQRLITVDHVDLLFAPWGTAWTFAAVATVEKYQMPMIGNIASAVEARNTTSDWMFFTGDADGLSVMNTLTSFLAGNKDQLKTMAVCYVSTLFGLENYNALMTHVGSDIAIVSLK